ncbi:MAG: hypothetical protein IID33_13385, partial [Planctomycetes bacterium]|nr:hypothetical protein [Planctomycetota bacterium]
MARGRRSRSAERDAPRDREAITARETIERRWFHRQEAVPELAELVTGATLRDEPYHRWLGYKQGFAPALVRLFLEQVPLDTDAPLLDPFSGSGTFTIECARRGVRSLAIDTLPSLVYLT